jgi:lysophospholipase L1-like esterase
VDEGPEHDAGSEVIGYHPELGWVLAPGARARHRTAEFDVMIETNADGQRESVDYRHERGPGSRRVVALGDSFGFGYGVEQSESYAERLDEELGATEVLNLGVMGYGVDQMLLMLRQRGLAYRPDVVLIGLFEGDVFRTARSYQLVYPKPRFRLDGDELRLTNVPVPELDPAARQRRPFPLRSLALLATRTRDLYEHLGYGEAWPLTERIVVAMRDAARESGASVLFVLIPKDRAIYDRGWRQRIHLRALAKMRELLERHGIPCVDLTPALRAAAGAAPSEPLYFAGDGHWTPAGHRVAAEAIRGPLESALAAAGGGRGTE